MDKRSIISRKIFNDVKIMEIMAYGGEELRMSVEDSNLI